MEILKIKKILMLICVLSLVQLATLVSIGQACISDPSVPLDVEVDVGSIHFRGEMAGNKSVMNRES